MRNSNSNNDFGFRFEFGFGFGFEFGRINMVSRVFVGVRAVCERKKRSEIKRALANDGFLGRRSEREGEIDFLGQRFSRQTLRTFEKWIIYLFVRFRVIWAKSCSLSLFWLVSLNFCENEIASEQTICDKSALSLFLVHSRHTSSEGSHL